MTSRAFHKIMYFVDVYADFSRKSNTYEDELREFNADIASMLRSRVVQMLRSFGDVEDEDED